MEKIIDFEMLGYSEKRNICAWILVIFILCEIIINPETMMWADSLLEQWNLPFVRNELREGGTDNETVKTGTELKERKLPVWTDLLEEEKDSSETGKRLKEMAEEIAETPVTPIIQDSEEPSEMPIVFNGEGTVEGTVKMTMPDLLNKTDATENLPEPTTPVMPNGVGTAEKPSKPMTPVMPNEAGTAEKPSEPMTPVMPNGAGTAEKPSEPMTPTVPDEAETPENPSEPIIPAMPNEDGTITIPSDTDISIVPDGTEELPTVTEPDIPVNDGSVPDETPLPKPDGGFLIDEEGMIYGVSAGLNISDGYLSLPEAGCVGVRKDAFLAIESEIIELNIPAYVVNIEAGAFCGLNSLEWIAVEPGNSAYESVDGVLFTKDLTGLVAFPNGRTGIYEMPASVKWITPGAFSNTLLYGLDLRKCSGLTVSEDVFAPTPMEGIEIWYAADQPDGGETAVIN